LQKAFVKAGNFRRSDSKLAYAYLLTPSGIAAKLVLAKSFPHRKEAEYEALHDEIARLWSELGVAFGSAQPGKDSVDAR
jgi:hypothetical protein